MTTPLLASIGAAVALPEFVVAAHWIGDAALFAAADGTVRAVRPDGAELWTQSAVSGGLLAACEGWRDDLLVAGDDGALLSLDAAGASTPLATFPGGWIESIAASRAAKLAAVAIGKEAVIVSEKGALHRFAHDATVQGLAFEPNGRRVAAAHYGGATVSWAASPDSRRKTLKWKGSHLSIVWTRDAKFLVTTMQENALHGWRLQDGQHFRMDGYPAKIRSVSFSGDGRWLATAGATEVIVWPFQGPNGPMGQNAGVCGELGTPCTAVACHPTRQILAAGGADGELGLMPLGGGKTLLLAEPGGARVTALTWSADGRFLAFGCEDGRAGVLDFTNALG